MTKAKVWVEKKPWQRVTVDGRPHDHGFAVTGTETRTAFVWYDNRDRFEVTAGCKNLSVLKTTQSGYEGYKMDEYTALKPTRERIVATTVTTTWKYSRQPSDYDTAYAAVKAAFMERFYGPSKGGVYSPSVQLTLYEMGDAVIKKVPEVDSIFFNMPNLHFIPCAPINTSGFADDVFVATSEPHGNIEACVTRASAQPHARL